MIFGGFAAPEGGAPLTWLANPVLWFSWIKIKNLRLSFIGSFISTAISFTFMLFDTVKNGATCGGTDGEVSSCDTQIEGYGLGYFFWLASSIILLIGNYLRKKFHPTKIIS